MQFTHRSYGTLCMLAGRMFVRSFIGLSRNIRLCTTNKRLNLDGPTFAHLCTRTRYVRRLIFIQILNVLDLHFQGQRFESNTLASAWVKSMVFVVTTETTRTVYTNRDDVDGCQDMSRGVMLGQGVSGYVKGCQDMSIGVRICPGVS